MSKSDICYVVYYEWSFEGGSEDKIFIFKTYKSALNKYIELREEDKEYADETNLICNENISETNWGKIHRWVSYEEGFYNENHATLSLEPYKLYD